MYHSSVISPQVTAVTINLSSWKSIMTNKTIISMLITLKYAYKFAHNLKI